MMRPTDNEPVQKEIEALVTDEERRVVMDSDVPEEVKTEIVERLDSFRESDLEQERAEDAGNEPQP
ncbi:MAG: hypothetical protein ACXWC0_00295 [Burkholderiales bacterium]